MADVGGTGLSPVALVGSLKGSGKIVLADGQIAGLDPHTFDAVTRAVDQGLAYRNRPHLRPCEQIPGAAANCP